MAVSFGFLMPTLALPVSSCAHCSTSVSAPSYVASYAIPQTGVTLSIAQGLQLVYKGLKAIDPLQPSVQFCTPCGQLFGTLLKLYMEFSASATIGSYLYNLINNNHQDFDVSQSEPDESMEQGGSDTLTLDDTGVDVETIKVEPIFYDEEKVSLDDSGGIDPLACVSQAEPLALDSIPRRSSRRKQELRKYDKTVSSSLFETSGDLNCTLGMGGEEMRLALDSLEKNPDLNLSISTRMDNGRERVRPSLKKTRVYNQNQRSFIKILPYSSRHRQPIIMQMAAKYKCGKCSMDFKSHVQLVFHQANEHKENPAYSCPDCKTMHKTKVDLRKHNIEHHPEKIPKPTNVLSEEDTKLLLTEEYKCATCTDVAFYNLKDWVFHQCEAHELDLGYGDITTKVILKPLDNRGRPCPHCGKIKKTNGSMLTHIRTVHLNLRIHACALCDKAFTTKTNLKSHEQHRHMDSQPQFLCTLCGVSLKSKASLELHENAHLDIVEKPFACDLCDGKYASSFRLTQHKASIHSNERPFICDICGGKYKIKNQLQQHKKKIHEKKFILDQVCEFCSKAYAFKTLLKEHLMSVHKLSKEAAFASAGMRTRLFRVLPNGDRVLREKPTKPKTCEFCGRTYVRREQLFTHLISVHAQTPDKAKEITGLESKRNLIPSTGTTRKSTKKKSNSKSSDNYM